MIESDSYHGSSLGWTPWGNCSAPEILKFPYIGLPSGPSGVAIAIIILVYMYATLTAVCNSYLLPSLRNIWDGMGVTSDVVGATVMAAAAGAPELAIGIVSTFMMEADVGAGAIVGSSTFNCLVVPGICALLMKADEGTPIEVWPLTRDTLMFCISLVFLIFCFQGDTIYWYETVLMVAVYVVYILGMLMDRHSCNKKIMLYYWSKENPSENWPIKRLIGHKHYGILPQYFSSCDEAENTFTDEIPICLGPEKESWFKNVCHLMFLPITLLLKFTIPRRVPWLGIIMSIAWIAIVTYITTWMIIFIGYRLNIPDSLMGLTVIGFGLGTPELLSSMSAAKRGKYTMALCNALGANTFNILICLGLPWSLKLVLSPSHMIWIGADGLTYNCVIILVIVTLIYTLLAANKFVLDKKIGWLFLILYSIFVILSTLIEMNVFYVVNKPMCNIKDYFID